MFGALVNYVDRVFIKKSMRYSNLSYLFLLLKTRLCKNVKMIVGYRVLKLFDGLLPQVCKRYLENKETIKVKNKSLWWQCYNIQSAVLMWPSLIWRYWQLSIFINAGYCVRLLNMLKGGTAMNNVYSLISMIKIFSIIYDLLFNDYRNNATMHLDLIWHQFSPTKVLFIWF